MCKWTDILRSIRKTTASAVAEEYRAPVPARAHLWEESRHPFEQGEEPRASASDALGARRISLDQNIKTLCFILCCAWLFTGRNCWALKMRPVPTPRALGWTSFPARFPGRYD